MWKMMARWRLIIRVTDILAARYNKAFQPEFVGAAPSEFEFEFYAAPTRQPSLLWEGVTRFG